LVRVRFVLRKDDKRVKQHANGNACGLNSHV
jgi:hypothetical protein